MPRPTATLAPIAFGTIYTYSYARDYSTELFHGDAATRGTSGIQRSSSRLYSTFASSFSSPASGLNRSASSATTQDSANPNANSSSTGGSPATGGRSMHTSLAIIGSGPAAHTAAIYAARADLKPVLYEGFLALGIAAGGQLTTTDEVENYPGFGNIKGQELMDQMRAQSEASGATIVTQTVSRLDLSKRPFTFYLHPLGDDTTEDPDPHTADSIILATGAAARRLYLPGEDKYWGNGVSACAVCDGSLPIFRQKPLVVVGGGDSAVEEATYLAKKAASVTVLVRKDQMRASKVNARRLANNDKVKIRYNTAPTRIAGEQDPDTAANGSVKPNGLMTALHVRNTKTGAEERIDANGLFYAVGHEPATSLVKGQLETDEDGYVITDPGTMKTKIPGVFAAGDVQDKKYRQAVTSAGSGCVAALEAEKFLAEMEDVVQARDGGVLESGLERESEVKKPNGGQNGEGGKNAPEYRSNPLL
ncbi:MAG: thioredoxin-disulfide reductase [Alyxoria varia]|nr:MAG: thioredoxin-disulfide reductase [Alyxoria varia]